MTPALALLGYAACAAWCAPAVLAPLTRRGVSVRVGLAGWLAAMASVLVSAAISIQLSFTTVAADWPTLTQALCRSVAGGACTPAVYRNALYEAGVGVFAVAGAVTALVAAWRFARRVERARSQTAAHATAARLVGRDLAQFTEAAPAGRRGPGNAVPPEEAAPAAETVPAGETARASGMDPANPVPANPVPASTVLTKQAQRKTTLPKRCRLAKTKLAKTRLAKAMLAKPGPANAVVLDDPRPAAYCVAGHPAAIVVTTGSLAVLDRDQLDAVLAHERAHLAYRHHVLTAITQGLAAAFPGVPVFTRGAAEVSRLTEMAADDAAARTAGRPVLIAALLAIATGMPVPARTLGAAALAVPARVERLLRPSRPAVALAVTGALALTLAALALIPVALATLT